MEHFLCDTENQALKRKRQTGGLWSDEGVYGNDGNIPFHWILLILDSFSNAVGCPIAREEKIFSQDGKTRFQSSKKDCFFMGGHIAQGNDITHCFRSPFWSGPSGKRASMTSFPSKARQRAMAAAVTEARNEEWMTMAKRTRGPTIYPAETTRLKFPCLDWSCMNHHNNQ